MDIERIRGLVTDLDNLVPTDNAHVGIYTYSESFDECFMQGSQSGFLRFGVEILQATLASQSTGKAEIDVELDDLFHENSDVHLDYFKLAEEPTVEEHTETFTDKVVFIGVVAVLIAIPALAVFGLYSLVQRIIQAFG